MTSATSHRRLALALAWLIAFPCAVGSADVQPRQQFPVPPPPFSEGVFPCSDCHADMEPDARRRDLREEHAAIKLRHAESFRWCLDCHDAGDRDSLRLQSGEKIPFEASYHLCGQCHGTQFRDWRAGVHGKQTGFWNGVKEYLLCAHCHDPHFPRFKPMRPEPPPNLPSPYGSTRKQ